MNKVETPLNPPSRHVPGLGFIAGAIAGAAYTIQSAPHMVVGAGHDRLLVGALLSALGAAIGWLVGAMASLTSPSTAAGTYPTRDKASNRGGAQN